MAFYIFPLNLLSISMREYAVIVFFHLHQSDMSYFRADAPKVNFIVLKRLVFDRTLSTFIYRLFGFCVPILRANVLCCVVVWVSEWMSVLLSNNIIKASMHTQLMNAALKAPINNNLNWEPRSNDHPNKQTNERTISRSIDRMNNRWETNNKIFKLVFELIICPSNSYRGQF